MAAACCIFWARRHRLCQPSTPMLSVTSAAIASVMDCFTASGGYLLCPLPPTACHHLPLLLRPFTRTGHSKDLGNEVVSYGPLCPAIGIHRVVALLFKQQRPLGLLERLPSRARHSTPAFASAYNLGAVN